MHVAINAQLLSTQESYRGAGVSNYSRHLLRELGYTTLPAGDEAGHGRTHRYTAFVNETDYAVDGVTCVATPAGLRRPLRRILWEQATLPQLARKQGADLLHGLVNVLPLGNRLPGVVTVHDLSFVRMPETLPRAKRLYHARLCRASARKAQCVIAVSHQTADDLMHYWQIPSSKIVVVPNGVDSRFRTGIPAEVAAFRAERNLPDRFLLYLGTLEPRKNLEMLLEAFARWLEQAPTRDRDLKLVLAGGRGWFFERIFAQAEALGLTDRVIFPGFIPEGDLHRWYQAAEGFIYPSLLEGFGLPVLEAMACGTPVLCSDAPSLMEVAGDCALTFPIHGDPSQSLDELVNGISLLVDQPYLRDELRQRGLVRSELFSWQRTANHTIEVYESV